MRLIALRDQYRGYRIVIVDRLVERGLREISIDMVQRVTKDSLVLKDGGVIPLHRVVMILAPDGNVYWSRLKRGEEQPQK